MKKSGYAAFVVSDVHLGYKAYPGCKEECDRDEFKKFVGFLGGQGSIENLILLGDVLEFWRRDNEIVTSEQRDILEELLGLPNVANIIYVVGNHDFDLEVMGPSNNGNNEAAIKERGLTELKKIEEKKGKRFCYVPDKHHLSIGGKNFWFIHGYQLTEFKYRIFKPLYEDLYRWLCSFGEFEGEIASEAWHFWEWLKKKHKVVEKRPAEEGKRDFERFYTLDKLEKLELTGEIKKMKPVQIEQLHEEAILRHLEKEELEKLVTYIDRPPEERLELENRKEYEKIIEKLFQEELQQDKVFQCTSKSLGIDVSKLAYESEKEIRYSTMDERDEEKFRWNYEAVFNETLGENDYVVFGHTHVPIKPNDGSRVANAGCWYKDADKCYLTINSDGSWNLNPYHS